MQLTFEDMQGSTSDLQFLILLNLTIILIGGGLRHFLLHRNLPSGGTPTLGQDLYRVRVAPKCCTKRVLTPVGLQDKVIADSLPRLS